MIDQNNKLLINSKYSKKRTTGLGHVQVQKHEK